MKSISIVVPHRNASILLERLLKSVPAELDAQIIVVDDNSNDAEVAEVEKLSSLYRFELYNNSGGEGAGAARNCGLKYAVGDWVMFADSDDFFLDTLLDKFVEYQDSIYDIIYFNICSCYSDTLEPAYRDEHVKSMINKYLESGKEGYLRYNYLSPWGKLISRSLLVDNNIDFEEIIAGNDMMFSIESGLAAGEIHCDTSPIYMLTVSSGSITTTLTKDRFQSRLMATFRVNERLRENKQSAFQASLLYFLAKANQFGLKYALYVFYLAIKHRANLFIGLNKLFRYKKVLQDRQNRQFIKN